MKKLLGILFVAFPFVMAAQMTYVPDDNFERTLINMGFDSGPLNDSVPTVNIDTVTSLDVSLRLIYDLTGIEDFIALEVLDCTENNLTSLNLNNNTNLETLACSINQIKNLDLNNNPALKKLLCHSNQLRNLDISHITALEEFIAWANPFLYCIQVADTSYAAHQSWYKDNWAFYSVDCSSFEPPDETYIPDDNFEMCLINKGLDTGPLNDSVPTLPIASYIVLYIDDSNISDLTGIEAFSSLQVLLCNNNKLTKLDLSKNTKLIELECHSNHLSSLDIRNSPALTRLTCYSNELTSLDITKDTNLRYLLYNSNQITDLDLSKNAKLEELYCSSNQITYLDLSNNFTLRRLQGTDNRLTSLDLSGNLSLRYLDLINNPDLYCIQVFDSSKAANNEYWYKDTIAIYSEDCSSVGVDEGIDVSDDVSLSPNPASDYIEINAGNRHACSLQQEINIYNTMGECVFTLTPAISQREKVLKIDVSRLTAGLYFVRVGDRVSKFIKI